MYQLLQLFDNFVFRSPTHDFLSSINICWAETPSAIDVHPLSGISNHNIELDSQYGIEVIAHMHPYPTYFTIQFHFPSQVVLGQLETILISARIKGVVDVGR